MLGLTAGQSGAGRSYCGIAQVELTTKNTRACLASVIINSGRPLVAFVWSSVPGTRALWRSRRWRGCAMPGCICKTGAQLTGSDTCRFGLSNCCSSALAS